MQRAIGGRPRRRRRTRRGDWPPQPQPPRATPLVRICPPIAVVTLAVLAACQSTGLSLPPPAKQLEKPQTPHRRRGHCHRARTFVVAGAVPPGVGRRPPEWTGPLLHSVSGGAAGEPEPPGSDAVGSADAAPVGGRNLGMSAALFSTYFAVMGAKCALPSTLPLLTSSKSGMSFPPGYGSTPNAAMARLLTASTMAIAIGKFLLGPVIDRFGGTVCLRVALAALAGCLSVVATTTTFATFARAWVMVDFIFSACWAACLSAVHETFREEEWPGKVGLLAVAARTGNAAAFAAFASVLARSSRRAEAAAAAAAVATGGGGAAAAVQSSWRAVFWVAAAAQILPLSLLSIFGRRTAHRQPDCGADVIARDDSEGTTSIRESVRVLRREASTPQFWLHMLSRSALMVYASFLLFVPSLMTNCFGMTSSQAARSGSLYALGCLLAVSAGSKRYADLKVRGRIVAVAGQLGTATLSALLLLAHVGGVVSLPPIVGAALMFVWGLSFAVPFYIPPSLFALQRGGSKSSATIADAFDFGGFSLLALFNGYVAGLPQDRMASWVPTFLLLAACSVTSLVSLVAAALIDERTRSRD